ncbi:MAG TPA: phage holin family protein [Paraburkholderia sp.]|nr:phage holin family protein [Paraburkholderia sp.]
MQLDGEKWIESLSQVALAFFGGLIGALMRREASTWQTALLGALGAGFVGLLVAKFCHATGVSDDMTFVFVGVSGWLGAQRTIDWLERMIEQKLGVDLDGDGGVGTVKSDDTNGYNKKPDNAAKVESPEGKEKS